MLHIFSKSREKGTTYEGVHYKYNPWAVCHTTVDKDEDPEKYERCVHHVKDKDAEKKDDEKDS